MTLFEHDQGPWFVRVIQNQVSVGIFACSEDELALLVDEAVDIDACEYKRLPPGGWIFGGEVVLHTFESESDSPHMNDTRLTESWLDGAYDDSGPWHRFITAANDE